MKRKTLFSAVTFLTLIVFLLFSAGFVCLGNHECCGEGCPVCAQMRACEQALKGLLLALAAFSVLLLSGNAFPVPAGETDVRLFPTPVALKVKLSD